MDDTPRITELRKKLEKDPASRAFGQLAEELRKEGRLGEAIEIGRSGLERHPNYPSARLTVARALLESGRASEARPDLEKIVGAAPDNIMASRLLAEALEDLGEPDAALRQFEHTLRLSPGEKALVQKIDELKAAASQVPAAVEPAAEPAPASLPQITVSDPAPPVAHDDVPPPAVATEALPSALPEEPLPSALPEPTVAPVPRAQTRAEAAGQMAGVALDRDLASGTLSPGTLKAPDLQHHFDEIASREGESASAASPPPDDPGEVLPVVEVPSDPAPGGEPPSVEIPSEHSDVGASTLPLSSLTLADLYLQQGLRAEASAVLSQVLKEEPGNSEARSKLDSIAEAAATAVPPRTLPVLEAPGADAGAIPAPPPDESGGAIAALPAPGRESEQAARAEPRPLTNAEAHHASIVSLQAFLGAVEREALRQRSAEPGAR